MSFPFYTHFLGFLLFSIERLTSVCSFLFNRFHPLTSPLPVLFLVVCFHILNCSLSSVTISCPAFSHFIYSYSISSPPNHVFDIKYVR